MGSAGSLPQEQFARRHCEKSKLEMDHEARGDAGVVPSTAEEMSWEVVTLNDSPRDRGSDLGVNAPSHGHAETRGAETERAGVNTSNQNVRKWRNAGGPMHLWPEEKRGYRGVRAIVAAKVCYAANPAGWLVLARQFPSRRVE